MSKSISSQHNPFIIGRPIYENEMFFGRDDLFKFVEDNLIQESKVILLYGQRRIGKSSVLSQIPNFVKLEKFVFFSLSLEGKAQKKLGELLSDLARDIVDQLERYSNSQVAVQDLGKSAFRSNPQAFDEEFLPQVYEVLGDKNLVLLIDEFDVLENCRSDAAGGHFFPYMQSILYQHPKLYLLPVVGRRLGELPNLLNLFGRVPYLEVGFLKEKFAKKLITNPVKGILEYESSAVDLIFKLTAGHPYFTQVLCFAVFTLLREEKRNRVTSQDVIKCIDKALEMSQAGLIWFHDGLTVQEQLVFSAVAEAQKKEESRTFWELLEEYGGIKTEKLFLAREQLLNWNFLEEEANNESSLNTKVKIELVRRWLLRRHPLQQEIKLYQPTEEELVFLLRKGVGAWNRWRRKNTHLKINLSKVDLSRMDLIGIELNQVDLSRADLSRADLSRADLSRADLSNANFSGSALRGIDLSGADLSKTNLNNADLSGSILNRANCSGATLANADLSRSQALNANFVGAVLTGACLEDWKINSITQFDNVICDYVYLKSFNQERRPIKGFFASGEFSSFLESKIETIDLFFDDGIDWQFLFKTLQIVRQQHPDSNIRMQSVEESNGTYIVRFRVESEGTGKSLEALKTEIENQTKTLYERQLVEAQSKNEILERTLDLALEKLALATEYYSIKGNVGSVGDKSYKSTNSDISTEIDEAVRLLTLLRRLAQAFPEEQGEEVLFELDDLERDLTESASLNKKRINLHLRRLTTMGAVLQNLASKTEDATTFMNNILKLSEKLGL